MSQTDEEKNQLELELAAAKSQAEELAGQVAGLSAENAALRLGRAAQKTAGAKDTAAGAASALERAAKKAAGNAHSRASVQEYMKIRRKF
jgi:hypothetical protein